MLKNIEIKDIMVSPVITAHVTDCFCKVEEKLRTKGIRHLPIVDNDGKLVGLMTQRDLYRTIAPRVTENGPFFDSAALNGFILKHVMTEDPMVLLPSDRLDRAVTLMATHKYGCIPVIDEQRRPVGIVTETDVLKWVARNLT